MKDNYKEIMGRQVLGDEKKDEILQKIKNGTKKRRLKPRFRIVIAAAVLSVLVTSSVLAVGFFHGKSTVDIHKDPDKTKFSVDYTGVKNFPLTAFSADIRNVDDTVYQKYTSLTEAEGALGIPLCENSIVYGSDIKNRNLFNGEDLEIGDRVHCYSSYEGSDGNLYRAKLNASYRMRGFDLILRVTVTAENDSVDMNAENLHSYGRIYESEDIASVTNESYAAENGIEATVVTVKWKERTVRSLVANFVISGISYSIEITGYPPERESDAKKLLYDVINAYTFCEEGCSDTSHHHYEVCGDRSDHVNEGSSAENHHGSHNH